MIVEDHAIQRKLMARLLTELGAKVVHCAADGESALAVVRDPERPVDIVITDLSMPGMDGVGFARHLSGVQPQPSLIICTSLAPGPLAAIVRITEHYRLNLLGAINKPLTRENLAPLIELHHARSTVPAAAERGPH
ncbi:response regulator [Caenimonas sp. S4]|nr:response regulator [Caenimonas soli]